MKFTELPFAHDGKIMINDVLDVIKEGEFPLFPKPCARLLRAAPFEKLKQSDSVGLRFYKDSLTPGAGAISTGPGSTEVSKVRVRLLSRAPTLKKTSHAPWTMPCLVDNYQKCLI